MSFRMVWLGLALAAGLPAAALPDQIAGGVKAGPKPASLEEHALWDEYGLQASERAEYKAGGKRFEVAAFRFRDTTGALAAFEWQRPADARPSKLGEAAAETRDGVLLVFHNYLLAFDGLKPQTEDIKGLTEKLPDQHAGPLPTLGAHLPIRSLIANSERYVTGPVGLGKFEPGVPAGVAGFDLGAEAAVARYNSPGGAVQVAVFSYPTPQIARQRLPEFEKLPGASAKRLGPMVAVVLPPADAKVAERLLSEIRYEGRITLSERVPTAKDNVAELILNIFMLIGIILSIFLVGGLMFAVLRRWASRGGSDEAMIVLHLDDRR